MQFVYWENGSYITNLHHSYIIFVLDVTARGKCAVDWHAFITLVSGEAYLCCDTCVYPYQFCFCSSQACMLYELYPASRTVLDLQCFSWVKKGLQWWRTNTVIHTQYKVPYPCELQAQYWQYIPNTCKETISNINSSCLFVK